MSPLKLTIKTEIPAVLIIIISIFLSFYFYLNWPDTVVSHWNFYGQPDGYSSKVFMAIFFPFLLVGLYALFLILPYFDPQRNRYREFAATYHLFKNLIILVLMIVYLTAGLYNLGYAINMAYTISLVIGSMMIIMGKYLSRIKYNWFVGIRTPWTMSSENVWNKTHQTGGWFFIIFGILIILTPYLPMALGFIAFILGLVMVVLGTAIYSYLVYRQEKK